MARRKKQQKTAPADLLLPLAAGETVAMATKVELVPVGDLVPYERNARTHPPEQIRAIQASIREYGFVSPLLIDTQRRVIAGHGRLLAAKALGMGAVPCVYAEHLTDEQRRSFMLADNRLAEMSGWDDALVRAELEELKDAGMDLSLTGFVLEDLPADDPGEPAEKPESSTKSEKTVICPECGCEFRPTKKRR